jgi:toxin FitB
MYLLDTVVLSELRKAREDGPVHGWFASANTASLFISVVTIGEVEHGIELQRARDPVFAARLATWRDAILRLYGDRVLPVTVSVARRWGKLLDLNGHRGADLMIAATALEHGLTVVSRNVKDFAGTGVEILDPFQAKLRQ